LKLHPQYREETYIEDVSTTAGEKMLMVAKPIKPSLRIPTYRCSWLSLLPSKEGNINAKATLWLYIEVIEEPVYLEFEEK